MFFVVVVVALLHRFSFPWYFCLDPMVKAQLRLQVSRCSTFLMACDVPGTVVLFVENVLHVVLVLFSGTF
jgi:hypothetical protein